MGDWQIDSRPGGFLRRIFPLAVSAEFLVAIVVYHDRWNRFPLWLFLLLQAAIVLGLVLAGLDLGRRFPRQGSS